ncbi:DUF262 domain-containing protein [Streptomyces sp. NA02536]|uniref:DUF262 domain-containing protein n=1 Tax=Streptomyces sp. NA02536 TaxID=2742133 RepID=UPI0015907BE5|nr:DUF262 domain-containing protein [Streptomyces sp. NA02536]QKW01025.1 DUF262 domain-containing protein [Streptomyces sp. NA02536]
MSDPKAMQAQLEAQRRKIDVDNYTITVRELLSMAERSELKRAPEYQRKFRWDEEAESRLIESILLGLPVPNLFFATNDDGSWEVVDGLQRISTLIHFASDSDTQLAEIKKKTPLVLRELKKLDQFNGLTYEDLPPSIKFAFTKRGLGVTALSDKSDPQIRFDTFERLNRGSVELSKQEVRACIYEGPFNKLIRELADTEDFKTLVKLQRKNEENATREELVLKFFAYLNKRSDFGGAVHDFLNAYMEANRHSFDVDEGRELFTEVVEEILNVTQGPLLRSNTHVTPQNELEAVMVACAELLQEHGEIGTPPSGWLDDKQLVAASTGATNTRPKLRDRIARAKELLTPEG